MKKFIILSRVFLNTLVLSIWIVKSDGVKFCIPDSGETLTHAAAELKASQIAVLESKKGTDHKMHAQVCGGARGSTNTFLINTDKLGQAISLGYSEAIPARK